MPENRFTTAQKAEILKRVDEQRTKGVSIAKAMAKFHRSEPTYHLWKKEVATANGITRPKRKPGRPAGGKRFRGAPPMERFTVAATITMVDGGEPFVVLRKSDRLSGILVPVGVLREALAQIDQVE